MIKQEKHDVYTIMQSNVLNKKRIIFMGTPGAGKGTQAKRLNKIFKWMLISTDDLLIDAAEKKTDAGLKVRLYLEKGEQVPDDIILQLIGERLKENNNNDGFILNGFPHTVMQAEKLDDLLDSLSEKIDDVVYINVDHEIIIDRLSKRCVCSRCGAVTEHWEIQKENKCSFCNCVLKKSNNEKPDRVRQRLKYYETQTHSLVQYYQGRGLLRNIDGHGERDEVSQRVIHKLGLE